MKAWVRYGDRPFRVDAELIQWTERACAISWHIEGVGEQKAWSGRPLFDRGNPSTARHYARSSEGRPEACLDV